MSEAGIVKLVLVYGVRVRPVFEFDPAGFPRVACFDNVCHVADHPGMESVIDSERPVALSSR